LLAGRPDRVRAGVGAAIETLQDAMDSDSDGEASNRHLVLVVEDDPDIRECVQLVLQDEGYEVLTASNGAEAERQLEEMDAPCLMLLDLMMPVMSGWELLDHLRHSGRLERGLQVIVVSASPTHLPRGPIRCMRKPVRIDQLLATVRELSH
jgi:CheY-like chemotaxis protein